MSPHTRKKSRVVGQQLDNSSSITLHSPSSEGSEPTSSPPLPQTPVATSRAFEQFIRTCRILDDKCLGLVNYQGQLPDPFRTPLPTEVVAAICGLLERFNNLIYLLPVITNDRDRSECLNTLDSIRTYLSSRADASVSTEPIADPPKPTYASVACEAIATTPPPVRAPSPTTEPGSGPTRHSPKPQAKKPEKQVRFSGPPAKALCTPAHPSPNSKVRSQVRLVACIAGCPDALTSENPRWKVVRHDHFINFAKELKLAAPGCTPLGHYLNKKGNLVITFTPTTPRHLIMSKLDVIRGSFELSHSTPILFDTPRSTVHLANVPTRPHDSAPIFDQSKVIESVFTNPALSVLPITSQPRWLRHPSKITGTRSSVVFSFEDPDGAIAKSLFKTQIFVFGSPVTIKPWINNHTIRARPSSASISDLRDRSDPSVGLLMDIN